MRTLVALLALVVLVGCTPKTTEEEPVVATDPPQPQSGGVAPMAGGAAGGMSPVSGGESVDGAGMGGIGNAAKDQARRAAAGAGGSSMGATEGGE